MVEDGQVVRLRRGAYRLGDDVLKEVDRITPDALARSKPHVKNGPSGVLAARGPRP